MNISKIALAFGMCCALAGQSAAATNRVTVNGKDLFLSGMNLAWNSFGNDFADVAIDKNVMTEAVQKIRDAGGNSLRIWMFTNNVNAPKFGADSLTSGLGAYTIANTKTLLDIADSNGVVVSLCLLSFDMMQDNASTVLGPNVKMLTTDAGTTAFINKALIPLVKGIGNHRSIMSWEIFNEPEGMAGDLAGAPLYFGWATNSSKISKANLQRFTNKVAAAIHANTTVPVSSSIANFTALNFWKDDSLIAKGGEATGTLDFYQVHYYPNYGDSNTSPFVHPASFWGSAKPIVIGEMPATDWGPVAANNATVGCQTASTLVDAMKYLYNNGYAGGMTWTFMGESLSSNNCSYTGNYKTTAPALDTLFHMDSASIKIRSVTRAAAGGNGVMSVSFVKLGTTEYPELHSDAVRSLTGKTNFCFDLLLTAGSTGSLKFTPVFKDSAWTWTPSSTYYTPTTAGTWKTYCTPISSFTWAGASRKTNSLEIQFMGDAAAFTGKVYIDNVRLDTDTLFNFNDGYGMWSLYAGTPTVASRVTDISAFSLSNPTPTIMHPTKDSDIAIWQSGRIMQLQGTASMLSVQVLDINGALLQQKQGFGSATVDLSKAPHGYYLIRATQGMQILNRMITIR